MRTTLVLALALLAGCASIQESEGYTSRTSRRTGLEVRSYPAGVIVDAMTQLPIGDTDVWHVEAGVNVTDRRDWGEHDEEEGDGTGFGGGWRRYETTDRTGMYWGARFDVWALEVDWEDDDGDEGTSDVLVLMPSVEAGWAWAVGGPWVIEGGLAAGAEINVDTDGEDVGEGGILLLQLGVSAGF